MLVGPGVVILWCCPCLAPWLAALSFGVVCLGAPLPCVVFCGAVLSCGGVLSCSAVFLRRCLCLLFVSCHCASALCVLECPAVRSLSSLPCAVLCCAVLLPLRSAVCVVCAVSAARYCWFLVPLPAFGGPLVASVSLALSFGGLCRCLCPCLSASHVTQRLAVFPCGVLLPCVVSCGAVLPCGAVLWCPVVFLFCLAGGAGFLFLLRNCVLNR